MALAVFWPTNPDRAEPLLRDAEAAARALGLRVLEASDDGELASALAALPEQQTGGLVIGSDSFCNSRIGQLAGVTFEHLVPAIYQYLVFTAAG